MKLSHIITLLLAAFFFAGCASTTSSTTSEAAPATDSETMDSQSTGTKTAYDGSTGPSLLMERYKSGQIEGFRN